MPESSFVRPFTTTSRDEIFQWPSGVPLAVETGGIDSTTPSNSVARSPGPGGGRITTLTIERATGMTAVPAPGNGGVRTLGEDVDGVADLRIAHDLRGGVHLNDVVVDLPRRRPRSI